MAGPYDELIARAYQIQADRQAQRDAQAQQDIDAYNRAQLLSRNRSAGEIAQDLGSQALQGAVGLGQAAYGLGNLATLGTLDRLTGMSENFQRTNQMIEGFKSAPTQARKQAADQAFEEQGVGAGLKAYLNPALLQDALVSNLPTLAATVATGGAAGGAARAAGAADALVTQAAQKAVLRTAGGLAAGQTNVDAANLAREHGADATGQQLAGIGGGLIAGLATPGISKLTGAAALESKFAAGLFAKEAAEKGLEQATKNSLVRSTIGGFAKEAADESLQSAAQQVATNAFAPGANLTQGVGQQAAVGGLVGGILGGGMGAVTSGPRKISPLRDQIDALQESVTGEPVQPLAPQAPEPQLTGLRAVLGDKFNTSVTPPTPPRTGALGAIDRVRASRTAVPPQMDVQELSPFEVPGAPVEDITLQDVENPTPPSELAPYAQPPLMGVQEMSPQEAAPYLPTENIDLADVGLPQPTVEEVPPAELAAGWKQQLVKDLGVKPSQLKGKDWDAFTAAAAEAGVHPASPQAPAFLRTIADQLGQNEAGASNFAIRLAERHGTPPLMDVEELQGETPQAAATETSETPTEPPTVPVEDIPADVEGGTGAVRTGDASKRTTAWLDRFEADKAAREGAKTAITDRVADLSDQIAAEGQGKNNLVPAAKRVLGDEISNATSIADLDLLRHAADQEPTVKRLSQKHVDQQFHDRTQAVATDAFRAAPTPDALDQVYNQLLGSESFKRLPKEQQDQVVNAYSSAYDAFEPGKFSRREGKSDKTISPEQFATLVGNASRLGTPVQAHDTVAAFTEATGVTAPPDANGVFHNGELHLIRENIADKADLAMVLAHERGHQGLGALLGDRLPAVTNRLWANASLRPRIRAKMEQGLDRATAAEEVLADMIAGKERLNGDVLSKLRNGVNDTVAKLLGYDKYRVRNADVDKLLQDTVAYQRTGAGTRPDSPLADQSAYATLDAALGNPVQVASTPRFSQAHRELDEALAAARGERNSATMNSAVRSSYEAGANALKSTWSAVKNGSIYDKVLDAMPLDRIVDIHGAQNPLLEPIARLKRTKEAAHNKAMTEVRDMEYGGETFTLSPQQLSETRDAYRRAPATREKAKALSALEQQSTLYRVFPERSWADQKPLNYAEQSFDEAERKAAYDKLSAIYDALGKDGQQLYKQTQAVYSDLWQRRFDALADEVQRVQGIKDRYTTDAQGNQVYTPEFKDAIGDKLTSAMAKMQTGPYSPLQRYGNYMTTVRDKNGKVVWHSAHDTAAEADVAAQQLRAGDFKDLKEYSVQRSTRQQFDRGLDGISQKVVDSIEKSVDATLPDVDGQPSRARERETLRNSLVETYLQSLPDHAFMQHANRRKGTAGATGDSFRAYNDYALKAARNIASLKYDGQISNALTAAQNHITDQARPQVDGDGNVVMPAQSVVNTDRMQTVMNAVKRQHSASQAAEVSPLVDKLTGAGFAMYMTSPSQMLVNALQTIMVAVPRMVAKYGTGAALKEFRGAMGDYARSGADLFGKNSTLKAGSADHAVMNELYQRGLLDFSQTHDMSGLARADSLAAMSPAWRTAMKVLTWGMDRSEKFNRQVTALAAARLHANQLGLKPGDTPTAQQLAEITNAAEKAVYDTHFDYSQSNAPTLTQGPVGRLALQFQKYRLNMLAMLGKDIYDSFKGATPEERKAARTSLAWLIGMQAAFAGTAGTVMAPLAFALADAFRDDDDLLDSRSQFIQSTPQWLSHGLLSGVLDVSSRVGGDSLLPILGDRAYAPKDAQPADTVQYYLLRNIGPWAGMLQDWGKMFGAATDGDIPGAITHGPKFAADLAKAFSNATNGVRDAHQVAYYQPDAWDTVTTALGLRSGAMSNVADNLGASYEAAKHISTVKQRYLGQLAIGQLTGDTDLTQQTLAKISDWNASQPENAIKASDVRSAIQRQVKNQVAADAFGTPVTLKPATRAAIGL